MSPALAAVRCPAPALAWATAPLPAAVDPLALLAAVPDARRFFWEQPVGGGAIAAVGAVATIRADGPDALATVAARIGALRPLPPWAVAVGGFAFDPRHRPQGAWRGFAPAEWVVPRLAVVRRGDHTQLVAAATADGPDLGATLARARAALLRPVHRAAARARCWRVVAPDGAGRWRGAVGATLADIAAGRLEKLVLARACTVEADVRLDPLHVLERLRRAFPRCAVFAVGRGRTTFLGASPEPLVRVAGAEIEAAAVAGTASAGSGAADDRARARALLASPKERHEHALVVEDVRARLAPFCTGLAVPARPVVRATATLQHLYTPITGRLRDPAAALAVAAALHPTPAVLGTPRPAALAALAGREPRARGWYAGGVGWLDADGGEVTVALRTALLSGRRALLHAGAGIVAGSDWEAELEETRLKMRPLLAALLEV